MTRIWHTWPSAIDHQLITPLPTLNRARRTLWQMTGPEKSAMLARLRVADGGIPAGRVLRENAVVFADRVVAQGR